MKYLNKYLIMVVLIALAHPLHVFALDSSKEKPILVKINQYFILYTHPSSPFIDESGSLMLPLRTFTELSGGKIDYIPEKNQVHIELLDQAATFDLNQKKSCIIEGNTFLTAREFFEKFKISITWDEDNSLLLVNDSRLMNHSHIQAFEGGDIVPSGVESNAVNNNAYDLISFSITKDINEPHLNRLSITAKNISGKDILEGQEDIHPIFLSNGTTFQSESDIRSTRLRPAFAIGQIRSNSYQFDYGDNLLAIIALGRTIQIN